MPKIDFKNMLIPKFMGEPMYPGGFPLKPENHHFDNVSILDIFLLHCDKKATKEQIEYLRQFVIYHVYAPVFNNECTDEFKQKDLSSMSLDDLIMAALDIGLDPFKT